MSSDTIVHVTDASFEDDVVKADRPGPAGFLGRVVRPLQDDRADARARSPTSTKTRSPIAKLNIDDNPKTPQRFNVRGIPTLILFKNGQVEGQKVGALRKSDLAAFLDSKL